MSIKRVQLRFESHFTQIPNEWARDQRLSRRARGLLLEVMSHSVGWDVTVESLIRNGTEGRDAVRATLRELAEFGYLTRVREKAEDGTFSGSTYEVADPWNLPGGQVPRPPENPTVGEPTDKEHQQNPEEHNSTSSVESSPVPSPASEPTTRPNGTGRGWRPSERARAAAEEHQPITDIGLSITKYAAYCYDKGRTPTDGAWLQWFISDEQQARERVREQTKKDQAKSWFHTAD